MKCPNCGKDIGKVHSFCPFCGARLRRKSLFEDIFSRFNREMSQMEKQSRHMDRMFEKQFEAFDITPFFRAPKGKGFTIKIIQKGREKPEVSVQTFGNVDKEKVARQVREQFQLGKPIKITLGPQVPAKAAQRPAPERPKTLQEMRPPAPAPKVTEEPKTEVKKTDGRVTVNMELPGVKSEKDIEVRDLEQSVEVKALAGDKAYFKILTKPGQFRLSKKEFRNGRLILEFS